MESIKYQAIFLDDKSIEKITEMQNEKLPVQPVGMHCTFKYEPSVEEARRFEQQLLGKKVTLKVIGYGSDGKNSGFQVALSPEQESIYTNAFYVEENGIPVAKRTVPHITVSLAEDASAVDTRKLEFKPLDEPFEVTGMGGFCMVDKDIEGSDHVIYEVPQIEKDKQNNDVDVDFER